MELGYSITSAFPPTTRPDAAASAILDRARAAEAAGIDYVETGDHHVVRPGGYLQSVPTAARLTAVFDHVAPLFLLPLYNPILVAEHVGTISAFADRVDVWLAIGRAEQAEEFGVPAAERVPRFEEAVPLLRQLWSADGVTVDGEYYAVEDVSINPKADPRIVIGGTAEPAVRRAGRLGDAWAVNANVGRAAIAERLDWIGDSIDAVLLRRDALVLEDGEEARAVADSLLADGYRGWPPDNEWVLVGDPDEVAAELEGYRDLGVDEVVVRPMDEAHAIDTLRGVALARDRL